VLAPLVIASPLMRFRPHSIAVRRVAYGRRNRVESYQARIDKKSKNSYFDA
jgi:hypothetical protein